MTPISPSSGPCGSFVDCVRKNRITTIVNVVLLAAIVTCALIDLPSNVKLIASGSLGGLLVITNIGVGIYICYNNNKVIPGKKVLGPDEVISDSKVVGLDEVISGRKVLAPDKALLQLLNEYAERYSSPNGPELVMPVQKLNFQGNAIKGSGLIDQTSADQTSAVKYFCFNIKNIQSGHKGVLIVRQSTGASPQFDILTTQASLFPAMEFAMTLDCEAHRHICNVPLFTLSANNVVNQDTLIRNLDLFLRSISDRSGSWNWEYPVK